MCLQVAVGGCVQMGIGVCTVCVFEWVCVRACARIGERLLGGSGLRWGRTGGGGRLMDRRKGDRWTKLQVMDGWWR